MKVIWLFVTLVFFTATASAKTHDWKTGQVVGIDSIDSGSVSIGSVSANMVTIRYSVQVGKILYSLDYSYYPAVKHPGPGQNSAKGAPDLTVNGTVLVSIEGKEAYVKDDDGRQIKLLVFKKELKD